MYEHAKNQLNLFIHSRDTADYRVPMTLNVTPIFDHAHPITIKVTFSFPEHILACKKSARFIHYHSEIRVPCLFLTTTNQKLLK